MAFANVDFGKTLYLSKFYEAMEALEGVEYVTMTEFRREGQATPPDGKLVLGAGEIPRIPGGMPDDPVGDRDYAKGIKVIFEGEA